MEAIGAFADQVVATRFTVLPADALRAAKVPVPASLIAEAPFVYASERVTFMLDDLRASVSMRRLSE